MIPWAKSVKKFVFYKVNVITSWPHDEPRPNLRLLGALFIYKEDNKCPELNQTMHFFLHAYNTMVILMFHKNSNQTEVTDNATDLIVQKLWFLTWVYSVKNIIQAMK